MLIGTSLYLFLSIATTLWAVHYGGYIPERQVMESNQHHLSQCDRLKKHLIKKPQLYKKKKAHFIILAQDPITRTSPTSITSNLFTSSYVPQVSEACKCLQYPEGLFEHTPDLPSSYMLFSLPDMPSLIFWQNSSCSKDLVRAGYQPSTAIAFCASLSCYLVTSFAYLSPP